MSTQRRRPRQHQGRRQSSIQEEISYIVQRARERAVHIVTLGQLLFFSTDTGDAWLLDPEDGLALGLAREGSQLPANVVETEQSFTIEWTHDYRINGALFLVSNRQGGAGTTIMGYPTDAIAQAIRSVSRSRLL